MKQSSLNSALVLTLGLTLPAHAALVFNGYDSNRDQLLYDPTLNITWLDQTYSGPNGTGTSIFGASTWASSLSVTIKGNRITGWTIPSLSTMDSLYTELGNTIGSPIVSSAPFQTISLNGTYWTSTTFGWGKVSQDTGYVGFSFQDGSSGQSLSGAGPSFTLVYAQGDFVGSSVPEPATSGIYAGAGLLGIMILSPLFRKRACSLRLR